MIFANGPFGRTLFSITFFSLFCRQVGLLVAILALSKHSRGAVRMGKTISNSTSLFFLLFGCLVLVFSDFGAKIGPTIVHIRA